MQVRKKEAKEKKAGGAIQKERGANKGTILVQAQKNEAKEEKAGGAVQKERGANKRNILAQARKKREEWREKSAERK